MRFPTYFISHGGGPWPWVDDMKVHFARTAEWLESLPQTLPSRPKAVVSVSGHWEAARFTVATAAQPPMVYDYSGFPPHTYQIKYSAPGSPELARQIEALLAAAGIDSSENPEQGFDHGTFVPLYLMFPKADVPVVSLSLKASLDPAEHLRMGAALAPLRDEGVLIMGSGLSYHNLRQFGPAGSEPSQQFESWLTDAVTAADPAERNRKLLEWRKAPAARISHPREDHLIPLMVTAGAAEHERGRLAFVDTVWGVRMASYAFGA
jgi:aromatic ring-opening dioxygenase catalytic subunit (LigB family)